MIKKGKINLFLKYSSIFLFFISFYLNIKVKVLPFYSKNLILYSLLVSKKFLLLYIIGLNCLLHYFVYMNDNIENII